MDIDESVQVVFFDSLQEMPVQFVAICTWYQGKWMFVRHGQRNSYEIPGGHIEPGEDTLAAARRELYEETGATQYELFPVCSYSVERRGTTTSGLLYFAIATQLEVEPLEYEMDERICSRLLPDNLTYPQIQTKLHEQVNAWLEQHKTVVYLIRHAQSDLSVKEDRNRPLTEKGLADAWSLPAKLGNIAFDCIYSSPYLRAVKTVEALAESQEVSIHMHNAFRERKIDSEWIEDFNAFSKKQWEDFTFKLADGECLADVQKRNIMALNEIIQLNPCKTIAIGTHGTALSTMIHYFDPTFSYESFRRLVPIMPYVMKMEFIGQYFLQMEEIPL